MRTKSVATQYACGALRGGKLACVASVSCVCCVAPRGTCCNDAGRVHHTSRVRRATPDRASESATNTRAIVSVRRGEQVRHSVLSFTRRYSRALGARYSPVLSVSQYSPVPTSNPCSAVASAGRDALRRRPRPPSRPETPKPWAGSALAPYTPRVLQYLCDPRLLRRAWRFCFAAVRGLRLVE
jgi:hypothetical protein